MDGIVSSAAAAAVAAAEAAAAHVSSAVCRCRFLSFISCLRRCLYLISFPSLADNFASPSYIHASYMNEALLIIASYSLPPPLYMQMATLATSSSHATSFSYPSYSFPFFYPLHILRHLSAPLPSRLFPILLTSSVFSFTCCELHALLSLLAHKLPSRC